MLTNKIKSSRSGLEDVVSVRKSRGVAMIEALCNLNRRRRAACNGCSINSAVSVVSAQCLKAGQNQNALYHCLH